MNIFTEEKEKEFLSWIEPEIREAYSNLGKRREKLNKYRRTRINEPVSEVKNYPFPGASNVEVPMVSSLINTQYGNLEAAFSTNENLIMVSPLRKNDKLLADQAKALSKLYDFKLKDLGFKRKNSPFLYEAGSLGSGFVKFPWVSNKVKYMRTGDSGVEEEVVAKGVTGPDFQLIMEENVVYPEGCDDVQRLPWIGLISQLYPHEIEMRENDEVYEAGTYEALKSYLGVSSVNENIPKEDRRQSRDEGSLDNMLDIYEVYAYFDPDDSGVRRDIIVTVHLDSGLVMRAENNEMGVRPLEVGGYMLIPHSITERGICQMAEGMQDEATTMHNMRIDNDRFNMNSMLKVKKDRGISPNSTAYPGKIWWVEEADDIQPLQLQPVQNASIPVENQALQYASRNSGISDIMAGFADQTLKSRDTLGGQTLRLNQGNGMFNSIIEGFRDFYVRMAKIFFFHFVSHKEEIVGEESKIGRFSEQELELLDGALNIPLDEVPLKLVFSVRTKDIEDTKDIKRNNLMMLFQLQNQYLQTNMPVLMQMYAPGVQMPEEIRNVMFKHFESQTLVLGEMVDLLGFNVKDDYVVDIDAYKEKERAMQMQQMIMQMQRAMAGGQQGPQVPQVPRSVGQGVPQGVQGQNGEVESEGEVNDFRR